MATCWRSPTEPVWTIRSRAVLTASMGVAPARICSTARNDAQTVMMSSPSPVAVAAPKRGST